ncbi:arabinose isomerase [Sorangium cellulosum So0157-2]|uniref:L-arabinose isomerase n=2 Tax=Sorangium cellulosum TaxID=56 RepID=S4XX32_SORCE|nr:L-arabinose isomerase [Sorangium cellulosum]AGP35173.1 arabinose isomerase [Sorangium cellulosum So0157-2]
MSGVAMQDLRESFEVWFLTGSQDLYGEDTLKQVAEHAREIAGYLDASGKLPVKVVWKPTLKSPEAILAVCREANATPRCAGVITWMHTFSPAKMWIAGLTRLEKPIAHLHTQHGRELPWGSIDMDFMNLHQSAHGDREFGYIGARLRIERKVVVGHWQDDDVLAKLDVWARAACAMLDARRLKIARFGGMNMREVAVTGGDRVEAQVKLGWSVNGYGVGDLVGRIADVDEAEVDRLVAEYDEAYTVAPALRKGGARRNDLRYAARQEAALRTFLKEGGFGGFTTTFEDLHGLKQLPGLAVQRLMADGYGFGAEGDWKSCGLVRALKVMATGLRGGVSFMEDYTYHLVDGKERVLGAHMLEICPTIAAGRPSLEIHPLSIGGKSDPCRLVFDSGTGPAVNVSMIDLGGRMRMVANELEAVPPEEEMPNLPVARAVWIPRPDFKRACEAWILAGGAHHCAHSRAVTMEHLEDFASIAGVELIRIGVGTEIHALRNELRWNDLAYRLSR